MTNQIEAIQNIARPATGRQLQRFIGMINFYRDMWIRHSAITSTKSRWEWTNFHQISMCKNKGRFESGSIVIVPTFCRYKSKGKNSQSNFSKCPHQSWNVFIQEDPLCILYKFI
jgi:hypothetical protein